MAERVRRELRVRVVFDASPPGTFERGMYANALTYAGMCANALTYVGMYENALTYVVDGPPC